MKNEKTVKNIMWICTLITMVVALFASYGRIPAVVVGILAMISMFFCEVGAMEHEEKTHGNNGFGSSYMIGLAISLVLISILMAFTNLWLVVLWAVISVGGGYLLAKLFMKQNHTDSTQNA